MINNIVSLFVGFIGIVIVLGLLSPFFMLGDINKNVVGKIQERSNFVLSLQGDN
jgi:hypothetical protein